MSLTTGERTRVVAVDDQAKACTGAERVLAVAMKRHPTE